MNNLRVSTEPHDPVSEQQRDYVWSNISEEMLAGHQETARNVTFRGQPDEVEKSIHSAQVALIRYRSRAVRRGRINNFIYVVMKRGSQLMIFNRPVGEWRKYIHRAPADVEVVLTRLAERV